MRPSFLLDTNVLSEMARIRPNTRVIASIKRFEDRLCPASIVWHELVSGCIRLLESKKRSLLEDLLVNVLGPTLPILPYDDRAAKWHAQESTRHTSAEMPTSFADGQIAAIAATNNLTLITQNVPDFNRFQGLNVENWHG